MIPILLASVLFAFVGLCGYYSYSLLHPKRQAACMVPSEVRVHAAPVSFPARDGVCLTGWWVPAKRPRGTIILSHGYSGDCSPDLEYAPWLTRSGYNLLYFDYRGHGKSSGTYTTLGYRETSDLLGAIDLLAKRGIHQVGILGFSMGGAIALMTGPMTESIRCIVADCSYASLQDLLNHHAPSAHIPHWLAPIGSTIVIAMASFQARANLFAHSPEKSIAKLAPRPVLIIQAGSDRLVPASHSKRLYDSARPPKELWMVEGADHRCVDKLVRDEYERRVLAFFDQYLGASLAEPNSRIEQPLTLPSTMTTADQIAG